ncbi:unnamed protein product [Umbelopsis sp. WA50703]
MSETLFLPYFTQLLFLLYKKSSSSESTSFPNHSLCPRTMKLVGFLLPLFASVCVLADGFKIIKPKPYEKWPVGTHQTIEIAGDFNDGDTVAFFFSEDRSTLLGGGPSSQLVFEVTVPKSAVSPPGNYTTLVAVQRYEFKLDEVQIVPVKVTS